MKVEEMKRVAYISGPMSGHPAHNYPAFFEAEKELHERGLRVINPAKNFGGRTDLKRADYMHVDIFWLVRANEVHVLPGWEHSRGAKVEVLLAQELTIPVYDFETGRRVTTSVLTVVGTGVNIE